MAGRNGSLAPLEAPPRGTTVAHSTADQYTTMLCVAGPGGLFYGVPSGMSGTLAHRGKDGRSVVSAYGRTVSYYV